MKSLMNKYSLITFLFIFIFSACGGVKKEKNPKAEASEIKKTPDTVYVERVVERADTVKIVESKEAETIKTDNNLVKEEFYVIGGSFKEIARAQSFQKTLQQKGYTAQVLKPHKGFNRVAIRAYAEEAKARVELKTLRKIFNDVSFWLLMPS